MRFPEQEIEAHTEHIGNLHQPVQIRGGLSGFPFGDGLARYPRKLCQIFLREAHCLAACLYFSADIEMLSRHRASIPLPADKFKPMRGRGAAGISRLVASRVDPKTGTYTGLNCHGREKVRRYREALGDAPIKFFYSDSLSDTPLAELAQYSYIVRKGCLTGWREYGHSGRKRLRKLKHYADTPRFL